MWKQYGTLVASLTLAAGAVACDCGGPQLKKVNDTRVVINAPVEGDTVATTANFDATANSAAGLASLVLRVGPKTLQTCTPGSDDTSIQCVTNVKVADVLDQQVENTVTFTATATDLNGELVEASVKVVLAPITIKFIRPSARLPNVRGTSVLELTVDSLLGVEAVQVTADDKTTPFANWRAAPYLKTDVAWPSEVGIGAHKLRASARDMNGAVASAEITINVSCGADDDCASGQRCCATSGKCNPIVGPGADCDCDRPCPSDQGCFPGTCSRGKSKCRPGCYPGANGEGQIGPRYYAERCGDLVPEPGQPSGPAYCENLPSDQATDQNKGGACKPANPCDLSGQNCANGRVNPDLPESAQNPVVPYSCVPQVPDVHICVPAGTLPEGSLNCSPDSCESVSAACAKGLMCVRHVDANGRPIDDPQCRRQCFTQEDPFTVLFGGNSVCGGNGTRYCNMGLVGAGYEPMGSGICDDLN
jgi:hypothetical protein